MSELPKGWVKTRLENVVDLQMGQSPPGSTTNADQVGFPLIGGASDFQNGQIIPSRYTSKPTKISQVGDLILCIRATIGKLAISSQNFCLGRGVAGLRPLAIHPSLLAYFLQHQADALNEAGTGTTFRQIDKTTLSNWPIPIPPLAEQRRIVAKLDSLFARTRRARAELARIPPLVEHYKQAILAAAFRGELTRDWRGTHSADITPTLTERNIKTINGTDLTQLPPGWAWVRADELCEIKTGIALGKKRSVGTELLELPYLRVANVQRGWLDLNEVKTTFVTAAEAERLYLRPGDILMNEGGDRDKLGRGWVWDGQIEPCIHQNHVFRLRLKAKEMSPYYVSYFANELGKDFFLQQGKQTTNLASISLTKLSSLPIPLAPLEEMNLIVERIESAFHSLAKVEAETRKATHLLDRLDQANLAKAFRGELVPQDPNDEPAAALLERIRSGRAGQSPGRRRNQQPSPLR